MDDLPPSIAKVSEGQRRIGSQFQRVTVVECMSEEAQEGVMIFRLGIMADGTRITIPPEALIGRDGLLNLIVFPHGVRASGGHAKQAK